jgi:hypothetical protein
LDTVEETYEKGQDASKEKKGNVTATDVRRNQRNIVNFIEKLEEARDISQNTLTQDHKQNDVGV